MKSGNWSPNRSRRSPWSASRPPRINAIIARCASARGISPGMLLSGSQEKPIVEARIDVMRELRDMRLSLPAIGKYLGGIHHTTVAYHLSKHAPKKSEIEVPDLSGEWAI